MEKLLLKPAEAAGALGMSRARLYELMAEGTVPSVKIGASRRIPSQGLKEWVGQLPESRPGAAGQQNGAAR